MRAILYTCSTNWSELMNCCADGDDDDGAFGDVTLKYLQAAKPEISMPVRSSPSKASAKQPTSKSYAVCKPTHTHTHKRRRVVGSRKTHSEYLQIAAVTWLTRLTTPRGAAGGRGSSMPERPGTSVSRRSLRPTVQPSVPLSKIYYTYHVTDLTRKTAELCHCCSVCLEQFSGPCPQSELHRSCFQPPAKDIFGLHCTSAPSIFYFFFGGGRCAIQIYPLTLTF